MPRIPLRIKRARMLQRRPVSAAPLAAAIRIAPSAPADLSTDALAADTAMAMRLVHHAALSASQQECVRRAVSAHGLEVDAASVVTGSHAGFSALFGTQFYAAVDGASYGHVDAITIPRALHAVDVLGLNTHPRAAPYAHVARMAASGAGAVHYASAFTPPQIASLYKFPTRSGSVVLTGAGQCIGIIELGGGYRPADLRAYFSKLGMATPTVIAVSADRIGNNSPDDRSGANAEVALDIEIAAAVAPGATIVVYFAANTDAGFYAAIAAAINDKVHKPSIISISWGAPERYWSKTTMASYNTLFAQAVAKNINVFVASGDGGSSDGIPGINVDFPASSPNVIACGGTRLTATPTAIASETAWNNGGGATGGGFSSVFAKPAYQNGIASIKSFRGVPDIAANADPNTGYSIRVDGADAVVGGTSAVAPLMAGLCALVNQSKQGGASSFWNTKLYASAASVCTDVRTGTNGAYAAGSGWDACTGLGRPNGDGVLKVL